VPLTFVLAVFAAACLLHCPPVVVPPCKALLHELLAFEALHELDDMQVRHINFRVLLQVVILLSLQHALCTAKQYKQELMIPSVASEA